jgi:hypothetical protein
MYHQDPIAPNARDDVDEHRVERKQTAQAERANTGSGGVTLRERRNKHR